MYASLMISLLAAFVAMLGKQWLNRYLRNSGGSTIERCGDRQRKCDGLEKWPLHFFVESLPVMLQARSSFSPAGSADTCGRSTPSVAYTLISLTGLGVMFYIGIVIAGMSSYACPFQTPASVALRSMWKKVLAWGCLLYCSFQTGALTDSPEVEPDLEAAWNRLLQSGALADVEPESPAAPPRQISANDPAREHKGSTI
jgi:hypothetical protein